MLSRIVLSVLLFIGFATTLGAQIPTATRDTLYGNEWISYSQSYIKIPVTTDGVQAIPADNLYAAGLPRNAASNAWRLYNLGKEQAVFISPARATGGDTLWFYGQKNKGQLDRALYARPDEQMLNPGYSLVNDTAVYFLTWSNEVAPVSARLQTPDVTPVVGTTALPWCWSSKTQTWNSKFFKEYIRTSGFNVYYSDYSATEGFGNLGINDLLSRTNKKQSFQLIPDNPYTGNLQPGTEPSATFSIRFACGLGQHQQQLRLNNKLLLDTSFFGFQTIAWQTGLATADWNTGNALNFDIEGLNPDFDRQSLAMASLRYPRTWQFNDKTSDSVEIEPSDTAQVIRSTGWGNARVWVQDLTRGLVWVLTPVDGEISWVLPAHANTVTLLLAAQATWQSSLPLPARQFTPLETNPVDMLIITHSSLQQPLNGVNWPARYADYRQRAQGGNYRVQLVNIDDLYDQYAYGVDRHPMAIRNLVAKLHANQGLKFVFLLGKGREYAEARLASEWNTKGEGAFLIPSFGYPASDNLLVAAPGRQIPRVPIGRLAAISPEEVKIYYDKVVALEATRNNPQTLADRGWMKRYIHLGGGGSASEQQYIRSGLENMAAIAEKSPFGAYVDPFYKTSSTPIQNSVTDQIFDAINEGSAIITFMGHSSPGTFDFNIDNPDNYRNLGKYPLMLSFGCYSGNIFTTGRSVSERFLFYDNRGAIGFGATRGVGYVSALSDFGDQFYSVLGDSVSGFSIGKALLETYRAFEKAPSFTMRTLIQQFAYHGDPAVEIHPSPGSDYVFNPTETRIEPAVVTAQTDTFYLQVQIQNLGVHRFGDSLLVQIQQKLPNGSQRLAWEGRIAAPAARQLYTFPILNTNVASAGLNTFFLRLNADDNTTELPAAAALNNEYLRNNGEPGIPLFIVSNAARPVYPYNHAIVNQAKPTLYASTTNPLAPSQTYRLELDTTALFNSPQLERTQVTQLGGLLEWKPTTSLQPNTVYYWRVSPDTSAAQPAFTWAQHAFTYLPGSPEGWSQSHYDQWRESNLFSLVPSRNGNWEFGQELADLRVRNMTSDNRDLGAGFFTRGNIWRNMWIWEVSPFSAGVQIAVLDPSDPLHFWINQPPGTGGSYNNRSGFVAQFSFPTETPEQRNNVARFIDSIPAGNYVLFYTGQRNAQASYFPERWETGDNSIYGVLEKQGASNIRNLSTGSRPYIFYFQKNVRALGEKIATDVSQTVDFSYGIPKFLSEGRYTSTPVGGAKKWRSVRLDLADDQPLALDSMRLAIYGLSGTDENQTKTLLLQTTENIDQEMDISSIDASVYPFLEIRFYTYNAKTFTTAQIAAITCTYDPLPDVAIASNKVFTIQDSTQSGQPKTMSLAVQNISTTQMDSSGYTISIDGEVVKNGKLPAMQAGEQYIIQDTLAIPASIRGVYPVTVQVNPGRQPLEQGYANNILSIQQQVINDITPPSLNVLVDGRTIQHGELISTKPVFQIQAIDDNVFQTLLDTTRWELILVDPTEQTRRLSFQADNIRLEQKSDKKNTVMAFWEPAFEASGTYQLRIQVKDQNNNKAGVTPFTLEFTIDTRNRVSHFLPYPNPFSTSASFVYTLSGTEIPDYKVYIYSVSGKLVTVLDNSRLGDLRIGTHQTDGKWDGTDEYGEKLANGVYLYRVVLNSDEHEHIARGNTDTYFKKGLGKLVILR